MKVKVRKKETIKHAELLDLIENILPCTANIFTPHNIPVITCNVEYLEHLNTATGKLDGVSFAGGNPNGFVVKWDQIGGYQIDDETIISIWFEDGTSIVLSQEE